VIPPVEHEGRRGAACAGERSELLSFVHEHKMEGSESTVANVPLLRQLHLARNLLLSKSTAIGLDHQVEQRRPHIQVTVCSRQQIEFSHGLNHATTSIATQHVAQVL